MRYPAILRSPPHLLFGISCLLLTAVVLVPELFGHGKTKDYGLWYWAGRQVLDSGSLYADGATGYMSFLYPPFAAMLLALPSAFGKVPLYLFLALVNSAAWWVVSTLSNAMTGSARIPSPWLAALPSFATISFIFDQYDLGQPNLMLLAIVLVGFWLLQRSHGVAAGAALAAAAAIKVFPVAVLPYLLWRRQWRAAASMVAFLALFIVVIPGFVRGFDRNAAELKVWSQAMVGGDRDGFGQRTEQNWSWINQSLIAVTHRLTRPINYNLIDPGREPRTVNLVTVDRHTADLLVLAFAGLLGLGFIWVMPRTAARTAKSDAEELAILLCLVTIASPLARQYYFVWLFFPLTVLIHRAAYDPRALARRLSLAALLSAGALMILSLPWFPKLFQALGNNLAATLVLIACLGWHLRHPVAGEAGKADEAGKVTTAG